MNNYKFATVKKSVGVVYVSVIIILMGKNLHLEKSLVKEFCFLFVLLLAPRICRTAS